MPPSRTRRNTARKVSRRSSGGGCGNCLATLVTTAIVIALGVFLAVYLTDAESPADLLPENFNPRDFIPTLDEYFNEDPFNATTPEDANRWRGTRPSGGLTLELVNALEESWYPYFDRAVQEWDAGTPDVLTLETSLTNPDPSCKAQQGVMLVCNNDFGATRWKGLNVVSLINDQIIESVAKMNEFYLSGAGDAQKQYTMCHEIGHGFGLPHTDENFNNQDTGECMDYTRTPSHNESPGPENFAFLKIMYGTVNDRLRKLRWRSLLSRNASTKVPAEIRRLMTEAIEQIELRTDGKEHLDGWLEEHRSESGSLHSMEFDAGYQVRVAKLLVTDEKE